MTNSGVADNVRTLLGFLRRVEIGDPTEPLPPPLPAARVVNVPGRGEMFVRDGPGAEKGTNSGGTSIVLLHGWTLSADLNWFAGGYEVAAAHGRVVAPDIRGHGRGLRSEQPFTLEAAADDVAGMLQEVDAAPGILVGYSMGGSIALLCAARHPELVRGLVLISTGLQWRASLWERVMWLSMGFVEYGLRWGTPKGITERYLRYSVEHTPDLEPYLGWVKAEVRRGDPADIGHAAKALARFDARQLVRDIDVPVAVVVTCRDHLIRNRRQQELARSIPGARAIEVDGAHNAWLIRASEFSSAVDEAIGTVVQASAPSSDGAASPRDAASRDGGASRRPSGTAAPAAHHHGS